MRLSRCSEDLSGWTTARWTDSDVLCLVQGELRAGGFSAESIALLAGLERSGCWAGARFRPSGLVVECLDVFGSDVLKSVIVVIRPPRFSLGYQCSWENLPKW